MVRRQSLARALLTAPAALPVRATTLITTVHAREADEMHQERVSHGRVHVGTGVEANSRTGMAYLPTFAFLTIEYEGGSATTTMHPGRAPNRFVIFADGGTWPTGMADIGKFLCARCDMRWQIGQNYCTRCGEKLPLPLFLCGTQGCGRLTFADSCDRCTAAIFPCHAIRMYE